MVMHADEFQRALKLILRVLFSDELDGEYGDTVVEAYKICKDMGKDKLAQQFADRAIACSGIVGWEFEDTAYQVYLKGATAKEVDRLEEAEEYDRQAISMFAKELEEIGLATLVFLDWSFFEQMVALTEELNLKSEKVRMMEAAIKSYEKDLEEGIETTKKDYGECITDLKEMLQTL